MVGNDLLDAAARRPSSPRSRRTSRSRCGPATRRWRAGAARRRPRRSAGSFRCRRSSRPSRSARGRAPGRAARDAALRIDDVPFATAAAMTAFSVAITLASSRKMSAARKRRLQREIVGPVRLHLGAKLAQREEVRVEAPAADLVAARLEAARRGPSGAAARERAGTSRGSSARAGGRDRGARLPRVERELVIAGRLDADVEMLQDLEQRRDVADLRDISDDERAPTQKRRRKHRQRLVLVARGDDRPRNAVPALDDEFPSAGNARVYPSTRIPLAPPDAGRIVPPCPQAWEWCGFNNALTNASDTQ